MAEPDVPDDPVAATRLFFGEQLPKVIVSRPEIFDAAAGVVSVVVHGAGAWAVKFGDHTAADAITDGPDMDADLVLAFSADGFARLVAGDTSDPQAIKPVAMGDGKWLEKLGSLMLPAARGGVGARLWGG
jgi:hypothetical protein